ncbi:GntR family transcriptional regulator [Kitasatospora viridis]|uniref:GntR family transcriptional regulator n=1 Tax=Kitasatospora viridis TaxID=281105 RepID=UPI0011A16743|nr:winged helix-turn-helix domain-containing protein [Kitasatospora viridis]
MTERSPRGTYLQIAEALRVQVGDGTHGSRLPSEAKLMETHGVGRTTVHRALAVLERDGLISSQPGVGWFVVSGGERPPSLLEQVTALIGPEPDRLSVGDPFPSEKELCERLDAKRGTVRRALAQLEGAGVLEVRHGKGRVVRALPGAENPSQSS